MTERIQWVLPTAQDVLDEPKNLISSPQSLQLLMQNLITLLLVILKCKLLLSIFTRPPATSRHMDWEVPQVIIPLDRAVPISSMGIWGLGLRLRLRSPQQPL